MEKQGKKLYELAHNNKTADAVVHALAVRQRLRHFIDMRRMKYDLKKEGFKIEDKHFSRIWKEWEKLGLGTIQPGRTGNDDLFVMNYDMRKVAEASLKGTDLDEGDLKKGIVLNAARTKSEPKKRGRKPKVVTSIPISHPAKQVIVGLDNDRVFKIELPEGLTKEDLNRISSTISQSI